ncbi:MAG: hypothetical protein LBQ44_07990 [Treponema sp.]|jgi:hypothetical protein|nr:hypothetical protein [Treponema sp.]
MKEIENSGYGSLRASFLEFREKYRERKEEIRALLAKTEAAKRETLGFLKKANRCTRYLTGKQRRETGILYHPGFFDSRIRGHTRPVPVTPSSPDLKREIPPEFPGKKLPRELKEEEIKLLRLINSLKKELLALDLLEMRCRELLLSAAKALEAFTHEYRLIRRRIYPFRFFSALSKSFRRLRGLSYFSSGDLRELTVLGELTGHVVKIADSPVL